VKAAAPSTATAQQQQGTKIVAQHNGVAVQSNSTEQQYRATAQSSSINQQRQGQGL